MLLTKWPALSLLVRREEWRGKLAKQNLIILQNFPSLHIPKHLVKEMVEVLQTSRLEILSILSQTCKQLSCVLIWCLCTWTGEKARVNKPMPSTKQPYNGLMLKRMHGLNTQSMCPNSCQPQNPFRQFNTGVKKATECHKKGAATVKGTAGTWSPHSSDETVQVPQL